MKRIKKAERQKLAAMGDEMLELRYDEQKRLKNALLALAGLDAGWMAWLEKETPRRLPQKRDTFVRLTRLVEARARVLLLKRYRGIVRIPISGMIARDWPFDHGGNLTPG